MATPGSSFTPTSLSHEDNLEGDSISCQLFNIALEKAITDSGLNTSGTILQRTVQLLAFANDIDIIEKSKSSVINAFVVLESVAKMGRY
ncbi:hypothetical protein TNCV_2039431 [Trichonephila clavipes]|nr:hypothetical protein TNCV_2039431 [Trichonephila clavipes]